MKIRLDNSKYIPVFFTFMLSEYMKVQKNNSQGSGVKMAITASELGKIEFPLPPPSFPLKRVRRLCGSGRQITIGNSKITRRT